MAKYPTPKPSTAITTAASGGSAVVVLDLAAYADQGRQYAKAAKAQRTRDTYAARWAAFEAWAGDRGLCPLPCLPNVLAMFLIDEAKRGISPASMQVSISAIASKHTDAGIARPNQPHKDPHVGEIWKGIRCTHGRAPRRVNPLLIDELRQLVCVLDLTTLIGLRDHALLAIGFSGALRRSELTALQVKDVTFTSKGLRVFIAKSKTDQQSQGQTVALPAKRLSDCPVRALQAWLDATGITEGPIFRRVDRHGNIGPNALRSREVARCVQRHAAAAGLDAASYAGHSLRAGLCSSAAQAGKTDRSIQRQGRWRSQVQLQTYIRDANLFADNAADGL